MALVEGEVARLLEDVQADVDAVRREYLFAPPKSVRGALLPHLADARDAALLYLLFDVCATSLPAACMLFYAAHESHVVGAVYLVTSYVLYLQRFMLTLHFSEHRPLFRRDSAWAPLNAVAPLVLAPLFGVPSGMYRLHHCVMHHVSSNRGGQDLSSTERFQRDDPRHFVMYWLRYCIGSWVELPLYAVQTRRLRLAAACLATEGAYLVGVAAAWCVAPVATLWTLILPFFVSSLALMLGNWSQHVFIDPGRPRSNYGLAYTCVNCADNARTYNDGYHVDHHANSRMHWSALPSQFRESLQRHAEERALVFRGIGFFDVGVAVFTRNYATLLHHLVPYTQELAGMSDAQKVDMLRARLRPIA